MAEDIPTKSPGQLATLTDLAAGDKLVVIRNGVPLGAVDASTLIDAVAAAYIDDVSAIGASVTANAAAALASKNSAQTAATLAGHYANDSTNADVPGGAAGDRGAKWWNLLAQAAAALAAHYANDNTNTDVPGGSAGDRGAKYWAGVAQAAAAAVSNVAGTYTVQTTGDGLELVDANFNVALVITQDIFRHAVIDALRSLISLQPGADALIIKDAADNVMLAVTQLIINHKQINQLQIDSDAAAPARAVIGQVEGPPATTIEDGSHNVALAATPDKIFHPHIARIETDTKRSLLYQLAGNDGGLLGIFTMSQSLGIGYGFACQPSQTTTPLPYAYKFVGGVRIQDLGTDIPTDLASIVPFAEQDITIAGSPTVYMGESPCGGIATAIYQLLLTEYGIDLNNERVRLLLGAPGTSGTAAQSLLTGAAMTNYNSMITNGKSKGELQGLSFRGAVAMPYIQSEQDYFAGTNDDLWLGYIRSMGDSAAAQNQSVVGVPRRPLIVPYQPSAHLFYGVADPTLAKAILRFEKEIGVGRCVPTHNLTRSGGDNLHLVVSSSHELGLRIGLNIFLRLIAKQDGAGIRSGQATKSGGVVTIPYSWLQGSGGANTLTVDTTNAVANYGYEMVDAGGAAVTINSVTVNSNNVQLSYSSGTPTKWRNGWKGFNNYWGYSQIRDKDPRAILGSNGNIFKLPNWAPIDEGTIL